CPDVPDRHGRRRRAPAHRSAESPARALARNLGARGDPRRGAAASGPGRNERMSGGVQLPDLVRLLLFLGLVLHKAVWEILKLPHRPPRRATLPLRLRLVKALKVLALAFLLAQTLFLDLLPILASPARLQLLGGALYLLGLGAAITARVQLGRNWLDLESF